MQKSKLRVGLLVNGMALPAWACRMIAIIRESDYAEIALVARSTLHAEGPPEGFPYRGGGDGGSGAFGKAVIRPVLRAMERFLVGKPGELPDAFAVKDATELLAGVDGIAVTPLRRPGGDCLGADDVASIRGRAIDVLVQLGLRNLEGDILRAARYGVWYCELGNARGDRSGPPGYWEVMESRPQTGSTVRILTQDPGRAGIAYRSYSTTHAMSLADNRSNVQWKTLHFIPRLLQQLHREGYEKLAARLKEGDAALDFHDRPAYSAPTNGELGVLVWKKLLQKVGRKLDDLLYFKQWFLLYDIHDGISTALSRFKPMVPPKDRLWADPFVISRDGKYYVFVEELVYAERKGHLSVIVMNRDGSYEPPVRILEAPYHLSYPFIFEFEGSYYLIPESCGNCTVELYRCTAFPFKWEFQRNLMEDCRMVDTTLFQWQGRWWMFANRIETDGASTWDELCLYYSNSPLSGNWIPHARNPVVSDVRSARPAGRLFVRDGRLYRPSQNCAGHYGYGFNICEITRMTESEYAEKIVEKVEPGWDRNIVSTHTINCEGGLTLADGQLRRRR